MNEDEGSRWRAAMQDGFVAEFGRVPAVSIRKLKVRGPFVRALAPLEGMWGIAYVRAMLEIEREITAKHNANRESLERLLSL
jgi:hypothetical protein